METNLSLQKVHYYSSVEECKNIKKKNINSNPRYPHFTQSHFTAGDRQQFEEYRSPTNGDICQEEISLEKNIFRNFQIENTDWIKYENIDGEVVTNTFNYIFYKFKKGIFVKIQDNKLKVFLPFSKNKYVNEWGDRIKFDPTKFRTLNDFLKYTQELAGYKFDIKHINGLTNTWYGNNCIFRFEYPIKEGDSGMAIMEDFLLELCKNKKVPDMEFFLNIRDFPLLTKDETEPYIDIFGKIPLLSHNYVKYSPILSGSTTSNNADVLMPTWEDWVRVASEEDNKFFPRNCTNYKMTFNTEWKNKKPTAVFRGSTTGCGVTIDTNMRLKVSYLSKITKPENGFPLLDAGINKWNLRPRKSQYSKYLETIDIKNLPFELVNTLSPEEQSKYKYIIDISGHVAAYRLSLEMKMGCVILLVDSPYKLWFTKYLVDGIHYVSVKKDLSNLLEKIRWCRENDKQCEEIAKNALEFYNKYLTKNGLLEYMQKLLVNLKTTTGLYIYNYENPYTIQLLNEADNVEKIEIFPKPESLVIYEFPPYPRCFALYEGVKNYLNILINNNLSLPLVFKKNIIKTIKTDINLYSIVNKDLISVKTGNIQNLFHEYFIGIQVVNELLKYIPNFSFTFCSKYSNDVNKKDMAIMTEFIDGITFSDYLKRQDFNVGVYIGILIQLCLALQIAQDKFGFVHYDFYPWNIIIQRYPEPFEHDYIIGYNKIINFKSVFLPIIIDYGNSSCIYKEKHYGKVQFYKKSSGQDILSILISSLKIILFDRKDTVKLDEKDIATLLKVANFISNTNYTQNKTFNNIYELKNFINLNNNYSNMLYTDKKDIENKTPMDFINYINNENINFYGNLTLKNYTQKVINFNIGNPLQVFNFLIQDSKEGRINTFLNSINNIKYCTIPISKNYLLNIYSYTMFLENINDIYRLLQTYLYLNNIDPFLYKNNYDNSLTFIKKIYKDSLVPEKTLINYVHYNYPTKLKQSPYNYYTFSSLNNIEKIAKKYKEEPTIIYNSEYRNIIEYILIFCNIDKDIKSYYIKLFENILDISPFTVMNNIANKTTFIELAKTILDNDIKIISENIEKNENSCNDATKLIFRYLKIREYV